jgi:hypothetical protein
VFIALPPQVRDDHVLQPRPSRLQPRLYLSETIRHAEQRSRGAKRVFVVVSVLRFSFPLGVTDTVPCPSSNSKRWLSAILIAAGCNKTEMTSPVQGGSPMKIRVGYIGITCEAPNLLRGRERLLQGGGTGC